VELTWGRLVHVHGIDARGETLDQPTLRDYVINENVRTQLGDWRLEINPVTQDARLVIEREPGAPDAGRGSFAELARRAAAFLPGIAPKAPDASGPTPFALLARNATLVLRFDDLLKDDEDAVRALDRWVRVLSGYPPEVPIEARVVFDPNHGGLSSGGFHPTRVLVDPTVSETEAADSPVPLVLNTLGFPRSEPLTSSANLVLRLPSRVDFGVGVFRVLTNLAGAALDAEGSRPYDTHSPTADVVRAMRTGNGDDANNGFLLDLEPPRVVGAWGCRVLAATRTDAGGFEWELALAFSGPCSKAPAAPDILQIGETYLEVKDTGPAPDADGRTRCLARALGSRAPGSGELLGQALYLSSLRAGVTTEPGCWVRFSPPPEIPPALDVSSEATLRVRFSEPMDPASALPFDTFTVVRGSPGTLVTGTTLVVGDARPSGDLRELTFVPRLPLVHQGDRPFFHLRIPALGGVTDLAGNDLEEPLPPVPFTIAPSSPVVQHSSLVMRFDSDDEIEAFGRPDLRGQFTYRFSRGTIRPREVVTASRAVDRANPIVSIMPPFSPGVATPLSPLGSKLQAVWRYADLGWSIRDENKYNLDVVGLHWSPALGQVSADFFEQFEIRLAHSNKLPDEQPRQPITGGMKYPISGLWDGPTPFVKNLLIDPDGPQRVVHARELGYRIDPRDLSVSANGMPLMPWPIDTGPGGREAFVWRDTGVIAQGGDYGVGVPLDSEVGIPLNLENAFGTFAPPGHVPAVGLPLLMEFRCYPSQAAIGLNPVAIVLASNVSAAPNFRAFSTGGFNTMGQRITKDPDLEDVPTGGFNPGSRPPGRPTARTADNSLYLGQLDYVTRISRVHTVWIDTHSVATRFSEVVLEPGEEVRPPGTRILVDFRGADDFIDSEARPFNAATLNPYGEPTLGSIVFHAGDPRWKRDIREIDGARYLQLRITFEGNVEAGVVAELSAIGLDYELE